MRKFSSYEEIKVFTGEGRLPKGGYILKILNVEEVIYSWGSVLKMDFDIAEGEYKGFYQRNFDNQTQENKKWKGSYRLPIPQDDNSEKDEWTKSRFKGTMEAFEQSNQGFRWSWDEKQLIGKLIGGLFNEKEWSVNEKTGWYTQCKTLVEVKKIKEENYKLPKDEPLKNKSSENSEFSSTSSSFTNENDGFMKIPDDVEEEGLPFN